MNCGKQGFELARARGMSAYGVLGMPFVLSGPRGRSQTTTYRDEVRVQVNHPYRPSL